MKTRPGRKVRGGLWGGRLGARGRLWNPPAARSIRPRLLTGGLRPPWHSCGPARSRGNYSRPTAPSRWPARARKRRGGGRGRAATARGARAQLRAPFDGVVTRVLLNAGSPVGPGVPVASLAAAGGWITAAVDEADNGQGRLDQTARITADAYPGRTFAGRVTRVGRAVEVRLGTRVVRVRIDLDGSAGPRGGTSVD